MKYKTQIIEIQKQIMSFLYKSKCNSTILKEKNLHITSISLDTFCYLCVKENGETQIENLKGQSIKMDVIAEITGKEYKIHGELKDGCFICYDKKIKMIKNISDTKIVKGELRPISDIYKMNEKYIYIVGDFDSYIIYNNYYKKEEEECIKTTRIIKISKTNKPEIYKVSGDKNEYLYIPTLKNSKKLKTMFKDCENVDVECVFNTKFQKWQTL